MKRRMILTILMTTWIVLMSSVQAFAITGLSAAESRIIEKIKVGAEINGVARTIPAAYLNQVENELIKNKVDITDEQAEIILGKIEEAQDILKTLSIKDLNDISSTEAVLRLLTLIDEAASAAKYKVSINLAKMSVNVINPEGEMIFFASNTINQTGSDLSGWLPLCASMLTVLLGVLIITFRLKPIKRVTGKESEGSSYEI